MSENQTEPIKEDQASMGMPIQDSIVDDINVEKPSHKNKINQRSIDLLMNVPVQISVELGRKKIRIAELLELGPGATLELPTLAGDPLDIRVNDKLIAKGEAVAVGDMYGVRILEVMSHKKVSSSESDEMKS